MAATGTCLLCGGCATPGPLHVYSAAVAGANIRDRGPEGTRIVASFVESHERLTGFGYDPFTDHFFLRLDPGNRVRVVDRPARAIKREFTIAGVPANGGGDLAVRPRDGHLFLLHPRAPAVFETTRLGALRRTVPLSNVTGPAAGLAYDTEADELLVLHADGLRISRHATDGSARAVIALTRAAASSLAYDGRRREFHARLAGGEGIGVFDASGRHLRTAPGADEFVDVGMRSFVRVF